MSPKLLSPIQRKVLEVLSGIQPPATLTGGAALSGFHLGHRVTRDLDLFWHGRSELGRVPDEAVSALTQAGIHTDVLNRTPSFCKLLTQVGDEELVVDLVAEPVPFIQQPKLLEIGNISVFVDTPYEILVNKLCALVSRSEIRDLVDLRELLKNHDLETALMDATRKDGGFSALTLTWTLKDIPIAQLSKQLAPELRPGLVEFRDELLGQLIDLSAPSSD